ncbi:hypothetical protein [Staphylococcus caeli]|uniref:hypothetical protein n=1 Tax=Staphylococcus caeli TaxID=2201815 RepID=UPI003F54AAA2
MTKDPKDAYNHFSHLNKFLKKDEDYRQQSTTETDNELLSSTTEKNIYKKSKSNMKQKSRIQP